jgi:hypothetical protein
MPTRGLSRVIWIAASNPLSSGMPMSIIWRKFGRPFDRFAAVGSLCDDLQAGDSIKQKSQPCPNDPVIVRNQDLNHFCSPFPRGWVSGRQFACRSRAWKQPAPGHPTRECALLCQLNPGHPGGAETPTTINSAQNAPPSMMVRRIRTHRLPLYFRSANRGALTAASKTGALGVFSLILIRDLKPLEAQDFRFSVRNDWDEFDFHHITRRENREAAFDDRGTLGFHLH